MNHFPFFWPFKDDWHFSNKTFANTFSRISPMGQLKILYLFIRHGHYSLIVNLICSLQYIRFGISHDSVLIV